MTNIEKLNMNIDQVNSDFVAIKNQIAECGVEVAENTPTAEYASKVDEVYDQGVEAGKQAEWNAFWDAIQNYGAKVKGLIKFWDSWNKDNFKPKYDVYANTDTFSNGIDGTNALTIQVEDLRKEAVGVNIDWSLCDGFNYILRRAPVKYIGVIDMTIATNGWCLFRDAYSLEYVEKLILPPVKDLAFKNGGFGNCRNLKHITFENKFLSAVQFHQCPLLTHESLINILNALYDYVNGELDGSSKDKTLTLGTINLEKLTDAEKAIATQKGWTLA